METPHIYGTEENNIISDPGDEALPVEEDWSKSHNGVMLCSFDKTKELMPEVSSILDSLINSGRLELPVEEYAVDVKVHMLMPNQYPCIPNWHCDFLPRDKEGNRLYNKMSPLKMYMWISGTPLTEYKLPNGHTYYKQPKVWHEFTQKDLHRGTISTKHQWRCFIRVIPKSFIHPSTKNVGKLRRHTQVYLDASNFKW